MLAREGITLQGFGSPLTRGARQHVPVLIAGGGSVGLSAALFLAHHGVPALAVERRAALSIHPRALGVGVRTVEIFRELGIDDPVRAAGGRLTPGLGRISVKTLASADWATLSTEASRWMFRPLRRFSAGRESFPEREKVFQITEKVLAAHGNVSQSPGKFPGAARSSPEDPATRENGHGRIISQSSI